MYRVREGLTEFLLVHPGGPFWKGKDAGAWTIPKGEIGEGEDALAAAKREFEEELGFHAEGELTELKPAKLKSGKIVRAWAFRGDCEPQHCKSNTFKIVWPPGSGRESEFPEVDQVRFFTFNEAKDKINPAQVPLLEQVLKG